MRLCSSGDETSMALIKGSPLPQRSDIPWQVQFSTLTCSGSLITGTHVITAAHCFKDYGPYRPLPYSAIEAQIGNLHRKTILMDRTERKQLLTGLNSCDKTVYQPFTYVIFEYIVYNIEYVIHTVCNILCITRERTNKTTICFYTRRIR